MDEITKTESRMRNIDIVIRRPDGTIKYEEHKQVELTDEQISQLTR